MHHIHHDGHCLLGGAEKYICDTVRRLLASGARVHVAYSGDSIYDDIAGELDDPRRLILEQTNWLDVNLSGDRRLNPRLVLSRARWFRKRDPDVVFVVQQGHGTAFGASIIGAALAGRPVVMSIRQPPVEEESDEGEHGPPARGKRPSDKGDFGLCQDDATRGNLQSAICDPQSASALSTPHSALSPGLWRYRPLLRMRAIARCCRTIIFNSRRVADQYVARYGIPADRVRLIPNSEPLAVRPRFERRVGPGWHGQASSLGGVNDGARSVIGAIGQVAHHKGADVTFEAFAQIAHRFPAARHVYFGDGPLKGPLAARARGLGLSDRVIFAGHVADRDAMFAGIDLLVMASRRESSSNAVAEAMARGLPCIVSDAGGLPELIEDGVSGLVVPAGRADSLAGAIERLLRNPDLSYRLARAAYRHAARNLDPATNGAATLASILPRCDSPANLRRERLDPGDAAPRSRHLLHRFRVA